MMSLTIGARLFGLAMLVGFLTERNDKLYYKRWLEEEQKLRLRIAETSWQLTERIRYLNGRIHELSGGDK